MNASYTEENGLDIKVSWSNIENPSKWDWIAVYCGAETELTPTDVLDWRYVDTSSSSGDLIFSNMINMRCTYLFRYYRDMPKKQYRLVAQSNFVTPPGGLNLPMHVRLSLTKKPNEIQVTWTSASVADVQVVRYTDDCETGLWQFMAVNKSAAMTYKASDMCSRPANQTAQYLYRNVGYFHSVVLSALRPSTTYCYQFGSEQDGFSGTAFFRSGPGVGYDKGVTFDGYG